VLLALAISLTVEYDVCEFTSGRLEVSISDVPNLWRAESPVRWNRNKDRRE
jgi:hypothetical protein